MDGKRLDDLLAAAKARRMTPEEMEVQRINFAVGNQAEDDQATVETVRAAAEFMKKSA